VEKTINQVFADQAEKYGPRLAVAKKINGRWEKATWQEYYARARATGLGLLSLGVAPGDRVGVISDNRLEWLYMDMGVMGIGASLVPIHASLDPEEINFILNDAGVKVLVVDNQERLRKALAARDTCPALIKVILIEYGPDPIWPEIVMPFSRLQQLGAARHEGDPTLFIKLSQAVSPADVATIVYTSGTTGLPKGALISHKNIMAVIQALADVQPPYALESDVTVPFLPLSHVFERVAGHFYGMYVGITSWYAEGIENLVRDIQEIRPTVILAVPRICEKIYQRILLKVGGQAKWRQRFFWWAKGVGDEVSQHLEGRKKLPLALRLKFRLAYMIVFRPLRKALGGRVRWMVVSGAPTVVEILRFFHAAGILIIEGYGLTESTAPATLSRMDDYQLGTAGRPLPGLELHLAPDGEILIKGDTVCQGYWNKPEETRNLITEDGFLRTGDIGGWTTEGYLTIVDRKKEMIVTSTGKLISPQKIENRFLSDPLFNQVVVLGEGRPYLTALLNLNLEQAVALAQDRKISFDQPQDLLNSEIFCSLVDERVASVNHRLARFETIKAYTILKNELSRDGGELTVSLKVKRKIIDDKFKMQIEAMYAGEQEKKGTASHGLQCRRLSRALP